MRSRSTINHRRSSPSPMLFAGLSEHRKIPAAGIRRSLNRCARFFGSVSRARGRERRAAWARFDRVRFAAEAAGADGPHEPGPRRVGRAGGLGFLGSSVIGAWFWGRDSSALRTRLKRLHDAGWVDKFRPKAVTGSREWSYQLTDQGVRVVAEAGRLAPDADRHARVLTSPEYAAHDLQIAALVTLIADRAARLIDPNGHGPLPERAPFIWLGAAWGRVDPREDPMADAHPKADLTSTATASTGASRGPE